MPEWQLDIENNGWLEDRLVHNGQVSQIVNRRRITRETQTNDVHVYLLGPDSYLDEQGKKDLAEQIRRRAV